MLVTNYCNLKASTSCLDPKYSLLIGQNKHVAYTPYSMQESLGMRIPSELATILVPFPVSTFFFFIARHNQKLKGGKGKEQARPHPPTAVSLQTWHSGRSPDPLSVRPSTLLRSGYTVETVREKEHCQNIPLACSCVPCRLLSNYTM